MNLAKIEQIEIVKQAGIRMLAVHQVIYERTDGLLGHRMLGVPCLLLRTVGARTGEQRVNALVYARDGEDYLVVASKGGAPKAPGWYHNLLARPSVEIQVGRTRQAATARAIRPGDPDYDRLWDIVNAGNSDRYRAYQKATSRPIPIVALRP
jgi:deazaflavin-dependent oxidoreductase (nitroreductase family)